MNKLSQQVLKAGISSHFFDECGRKTHYTNKVKSSLVKRLAPAKSINRSPLPTVKVFQLERANQPCYIRLNNPNRQKPLQGEWCLNVELGEDASGKIKRDCIELPRDMLFGYHQLSVQINGRIYECLVIVAPHCCYQPPAIEARQKLWGSFIQLYALKSESNWGIGDFGDLKCFIKKLAPYQADFLGLNPIHALFPANPEGASPYSPSSRRWLNVAYIDVNSVAAFTQSSEAQAWFNRTETQQKLAELRALPFVNYSEVVSLKLTALRLAFANFATNLTACNAEFEAFLAEKGEALQIQATFDALHAERMKALPNQWGWDFWDESLQDYHAPAVAEFKANHAESIRFYAWLQWLADKQLAECHALCANQQMAIGLYRDLAVGVTGGGAETWANKALYSLNTSIGAPPDMLAPQGQNWGLVPMNPHELKTQAYQPFIELVRANMQHCGALRLDHIMSLLRLWWIGKGDNAKNGAYVHYPVDDLLAILALESHRHQCLIIGEDLGIVPKAIVGKLKQAGILSYKIFYFEFDEQGNSRALSTYPYQAMTTLSTHDLPTIKGYWRGDDFELGQELGVYSNAQVLATLKRKRAQVKAKILARLAENGFKPTSENPDKAFIHQLQHYVAGVSSALFGFQPEDWLAMETPVNIPGTSDEYPNWRRKLTATVEEMFNDVAIQQLLEQINRTRKAS